MMDVLEKIAKQGNQFRQGLGKGFCLKKGSQEIP